MRVGAFRRKWVPEVAPFWVVTDRAETPFSCPLPEAVNCL